MTEEQGVAATVLVTGASSQLGVFLLPRLVAGGFRVLALSRRAPPSPVDVTSRVRWQRAGSLPGEEQGLERSPVRYLVSCGPLELACKQVIELEGLRRIVAFSTSSILTKTGSDNPAESGHMAEIQAQEKRLKERCMERNISLALLRPTLIYGCGLDRNISLLARFGRRFGFIPLAGEATGLRQPVHADDLAAAALQLLSPGQTGNFESVACGGSTLTFREMAEKIAAVCGARVRTPAIPAALFAAAVRIVSVLPVFRAINPEMVRRQNMNMAFDDTELREAVDYSPRPFDPSDSDFEVPAEALELQLTGSG